MEHLQILSSRKFSIQDFQQFQNSILQISIFFALLKGQKNLQLMFDRVQEIKSNKEIIKFFHPQFFNREEDKQQLNQSKETKPTLLMLEQYFKKLLGGLLSDVIEDFSENEIELSKWKGQFELRNLKIRKEFIFNIGTKIGFPLYQEYAVIEKAQISIPWSKIKSQPIVVTIQGIKIKCQSKGEYSNDFYEKRLVKAKFEVFQALIKKIESLQRKHSENNKNEDAGEKGNDEGNFFKKRVNSYSNYLSQVKDIVLQNIRFEIVDFQLKFEDDSIVSKTGKTQIGISVSKFLISPANGSFEEAFVTIEERKKEQKQYQIFKISGLEIFMNQNMTNEQGKVLIIHPIDIQIQRTKNNSEEEILASPQKQIKVIISSVKIELQQKQYQFIRDILKYKNWHCEMNSTLFLRPPYNINSEQIARQRLQYLFNVIRSRVETKRNLNNAKPILQLIGVYIKVFKEKIEIDMEQKLAFQKFSSSSTALNEMQQQNKNVANKKRGLNYVEKDLELLEKQLLKYPILPEDLLVIRNKARNQIRVEKSTLFEKIIEINKQRIAQAPQKSLIAKALQKENVKIMFQWISSKVFRKNANAVHSPETRSTEDQLKEPLDETVIGGNEDIDEEEQLRQEFNEFIESYSEQQGQTVIKDFMKGKNYIKSSFSIEISDPIKISLMSAKNTTEIPQNNKYTKVQEFKSQQNTQSQGENYEILHILLKINKCSFIQSSQNSIIQFEVQDLKVIHSINPSEFFQKVMINLDQPKGKSSLKIKIVKNKSKSINLKRYHISVKGASHQFILTDVLLSSLSSFFSIKQQSRSFLKEFNIDRKNIKKKIDIYLAEQIKKVFGNKIIFDQIKMELAQQCFLFPEKFQQTDKPIIICQVESIILSNRPIDYQLLKNKESNFRNQSQSKQLRDRKDIMLENEEYFTSFQQAKDISNFYSESVYKSMQDPDQLQNEVSYLTTKTECFHSIADQSAIFQDQNQNGFDELNLLAEEVKSEDESGYEGQRKGSLISNPQEDKEKKTWRALISHKYFSPITQNQISSEISDLQIHISTFGIAATFYIKGIQSKSSERYMLIEKFDINFCLKRTFNSYEEIEVNQQKIDFKQDNQDKQGSPLDSRNQREAQENIQDENNNQIQLKPFISQTSSVDDKQHTTKKKECMPKVHLEVDLNISSISLNFYSKALQEFQGVLKCFQKVMAKTNNSTVINNVQSTLPFQEQKHKQNTKQQNIFDDHLKDVKENTNSPIKNYQNQHQRQDILFEDEQNNVNTTQITYRDEEFYDAVEDFSQLFKHQPLVHQPQYFEKKSDDTQEQQYQIEQTPDQQKLLIPSLKSKEVSKTTEANLNSRTQSYLQLIHNENGNQFQGNKEKHISQFGNKINNNHRNGHSVLEENNYFNKIDPQQDHHHNELGLRDLVTLNWGIVLTDFGVFIKSDNDVNSKQPNNNFRQSFLTVKNVKVQIILNPPPQTQETFPMTGQDSSMDMTISEEINDYSFTLNADQNFEQQIQMLGKNWSNEEISEQNEQEENKHSENQSAKKNSESWMSKKSQDKQRNKSIQLEQQKVIKEKKPVYLSAWIDLQVKEVEIGVYKLEKIKEIVSILAPGKTDPKEEVEEQGQKEVEIMRNLKKVLMIKDSEMNLKTSIDKISIKFQDSRKQIQEASEIIELCIEQFRFETKAEVPIKFDFSELRYIEQLQNILNYIQYDILLSWKFNASFTNMSNKQVEPFVEKMAVQISLKQQNHKKQITYCCEDDILINFHPALIDNIFILQQSFNQTKSKSNDQPSNLSSSFQYIISNQSGIPFEIECPDGNGFFEKKSTSQQKEQVFYKNQSSYNQGKQKKQILEEDEEVQVLFAPFLLSASNSTNQKTQPNDKQTSSKNKISEQKIIVIIGGKKTKIDLLQSKDTYIPIGQQFFIVCQPLTYNDRKIVFRSNIKLINSTSINLQLVLQNSSKSDQTNKNKQQDFNKLDSQERDNLINIEGQSQQFIPLNTIQKKFIRLINKENQVQSQRVLFRDSLNHLIPICISLEETESSPLILSSSQTFFKNNISQRHGSFSNQHIILRRLRNEDRFPSSMHSSSYLSSELREIRLLISYPVTISNINPLPLEISFLYPRTQEKLSQLQEVVDQLFLQKEVNETSFFETEETSKTHFHLSEHHRRLLAGKSEAENRFNIFLMCQISVDLLDFKLFKPLELFDSKAVSAYQQYLMGFSTHFIQNGDLLNQEDGESQQNDLSFPFNAQTSNKQEKEALVLTSRLGNNIFLENFSQQKTLQLLNQEGNQMNLLLDIKYSYENMLEITVKSQFWFLNQSELSLNLQIKEDRYSYPMIQLVKKQQDKNDQLQCCSLNSNQIHHSEEQSNHLPIQVLKTQFSQSQYLSTPCKEQKDKKDEPSSKRSDYQKCLSQELSYKPAVSQIHEKVSCSRFDDTCPRKAGDRIELDDFSMMEKGNQEFSNIFQGANSSILSLEMLSNLFECHSRQIQLFTGNQTSEKQFMLQISKSEISQILCSKDAQKKHQTDFFKLTEKTMPLVFKGLSYCCMQINKVSLPDKFKDISFYIISPSVSIKNSSVHQLSVNQFISSTKSVELSLPPHQTRQLIYDREYYPFIQLKPSHNFSLWSKRIPVNESTQFTIKINHINKSNSFLLLKVTISKESSVYLITIQDTSEYPPFKIINLTNEELAISQRKHQQASQFLTTQQTYLCFSDRESSLFVKKQILPEDMLNSVRFNERQTQNLLKNSSAFGWDDPFGDETMTISTMDRLLCVLTKKELQEKNYNKLLATEGRDNIIIKILQDKEYPKTRIILLVFQRNERIFDEYNFEENIDKNISFELFLKKIGISIVDSHPREIIYFQMDSVMVKLKQLNKRYFICFQTQLIFLIDLHRFELAFCIQDIQGDFQLAKPLPIPFLTAKPNQQKSKLDSKLKSIIREEDSQQIKIPQDIQPSFLSRVFNKISHMVGFQTIEKQEEENQTADLLRISQQESNKKQGKVKNQEQSNSKQQQKPKSGTSSPSLKGNKNSFPIHDNTFPFSKSKNFFKLTFIQQFYQNTNTTHLEKFKLEIQPIETNIDGSLIHKLLQFINEIKSMIMKHPNNSSTKQFQTNYQDRALSNSASKPVQQKQAVKHFMIEKFEILPISVDLKFSNLHLSQQSPDSSRMFYFIMTLLNLVGSNKFFFEKFIEEHHLHSISDMFRQITNHYTNLMENQIFSILGNANLIGNPGQLFKEIGFACVDFVNTVFEEVHHSEVLFHQERFYKSAFTNGYAFTKRIAQAFKSSASIISQSIVSELFDHVDETLMPNSNQNSVVPKLKEKLSTGNQEIFQDANQIKNFQGNFVNLFHAAFLLPLSNPYSLNFAMGKRQQKLDAKKIKSLLPYLKVKRLPRAVQKIKNTFCLVKYDHQMSLGKLFFEAFNLIEFDEFENTILNSYTLLHEKVWFITKERFVVIDQQSMRISFDILKQDVSYIGIETLEDHQYLKFKHCSNSGNDLRELMSIKVLNLEEKQFETNFSQEEANLINSNFNSAFKFKNFLNSHYTLRSISEDQSQVNKEGEKATI